MSADQMHKELIWIGSSRKDMMALPRAVQRTFGYGLYLAQLGDRPPDAKPLKGFHLHVFQKKAKRGIETPKNVINLIKDRLKQAELHFSGKTKDN